MATRKQATPNKRASVRPTKGVDAAWFTEQFTRAGFTQRQAALAVGMDPAQFNRALHGKRRFQSHELDKLAAAIRLPVHELMARTPYAITTSATVTVKRVADSRGSYDAPRVVGQVSGTDGAVTFDHDDMTWLDDETAALRVADDPFLSGAVVVFKPGELLDGQALADRVGIVRLAEGTFWLRALRRGFKPGHFDLGPALGIGSGRQDDVDVAGVMSVEGIRF